VWECRVRNLNRVTPAQLVAVSGYWTPQLDVLVEIGR
jgi:hypothetical protein